MLRDLCQLHTNLRDEDILILENIANILTYIADLVRADVFIDCLTRDPDVAIVVAEAKPSNSPSMYKYSVVGQLALQKNEPAALRTLQIGVSTRDLKAITQENITVKQNVVPIKNKNNETIGALIMEQDATKAVNQNKQMQMLAETAEQLTETLFSLTDNEHALTYHLNDAIVMFNEEGRAIYSNPVAEELYNKLGYKDRIVGMHFENLVLDGSSIDKIVAENFFNIGEVNVGKLTFQVKYLVKRKKKKLDGFIMLIRDITEVKEKEKELILKSVAIKEIHHRVKNNLQTIASLLRLQSRRIQEENAKKSFNESINRILSISVTHEILAQNGVDEVDIKTIITKIAESTINYCLSPNENIKVFIYGDSFKIDSDKATSIALVVNEILQNCIEHAFEAKENGKIEVTIKKGIMYSTISIIDNGRGFDINKIRNGSLGLSIVKSIVKDKLFGHFNIDSNEFGTKILFDFKNE
ncbi:putative sensor histidine kinase pdtaS [Caloramator mitchellensis]|uniref:histidine kinase n=1 Tax=Caloramator mitchellensis TaxID=908809 RepID=A0A0R3JZC1_CALMK|nr:histidine kinase N-terminal domain-containing protein [Caloramator mitchellensis]KRQ86484.1 putative sensor histidine kinase pdtaS [Caloramator mitchellensis]